MPVFSFFFFFAEVEIKNVNSRLSPSEMKASVTPVRSQVEAE